MAFPSRFPAAILHPCPRRADPLWATWKIVLPTIRLFVAPTFLSSRRFSHYSSTAASTHNWHLAACVIYFRNPDKNYRHIQRLNGTNVYPRRHAALLNPLSVLPKQPHLGVSPILDISTTTVLLSSFCWLADISVLGTLAQLCFWHQHTHIAPYSAISRFMCTPCPGHIQAPPFQRNHYVFAASLRTSPILLWLVFIPLDDYLHLPGLFSFLMRFEFRSLQEDSPNCTHAIDIIITNNCRRSKTHV